MKFFHLFISFLIISLLGCSSDSKFIKSNPTGKAYDLSIVVDARLNGSVAVKKLKSILTAPVEGLPQIEPLFDVTTVPSDIFSSMFKMLRNLIVINVDSTCESPSFRFVNDVWANNQAVVSINVKNEEDLNALIDLNGDKITHYFKTEELRRLANNYRNNRNVEISDSIKKMFNISIAVPKGYSIYKSTSKFIWVGQEFNNIQQGFFVYTYPLNTILSFSRDRITQMHDSVLKANIPGGPKGSYMATEWKFEPIASSIVLAGKSGISIVGLWRMEGDLMGGPFVLQAFPDLKNDRLIVLDGFVYYPEKPEKRNYIRQLESVFQTVSLNLNNNATSNTK